MIKTKRRLIEGQDYVMRYLDFKSNAADGAIVSCAEGIACICINARASVQAQQDAFQHELEHLEKDDLYSEEPVEVIEGRMSV